MTKSAQPPRSLRTKLVAAVLAAVSVGLVAALAVTIIGVNSFMYSRLTAQTTNYLRLLADELSAHPGRGGPPPLVARGEWVAMVVTPSGELKHYWGVRPAKVPTPPLDLLRTLDADQSVVRLPGSSFLGSATTLPGGDYVVAAVSTEDYDQIAHRIVVAVSVIVLLVLAVLALVLLQLCKRWLRPLESVVGTARSIADGDLSQRVAVADSTYEVHSLTQSFNTMVSRLQDSFTRRQRAEDRLRRFVASAGHELRTPLSAISGYAQLAQLGALDERDEFQAAMRRVGGETKRMAALIDELLLLAELDRGRPCAADPVDLGPLCIDAVHDAQAAAPEWQLRHDIDPHRSYLVTGDAFRLRQTVTNLLANIRAHTPPGTKAEVWLSTTGTEHQLDILDDGPGIAPELRDRVFERFFQADPDRAKGSGLGLSIVAELIQLHGGTIEVLPTDRGCWIRVRLPASKVPPDETADPAAPSTPAAAGESAAASS